MNAARLTLLLALLPGGIARACPEKVPAGMHAVSVAEAVAVAGVDVAILQVDTREHAAAVLERVTRDWRDAGYAVKRNEAQGWQVLSALSEKCMTTLQLVERDGAFGYLAVNRFTRTAAVRLPVPPIPSGAKVLSNVVSDDDGRRGQTMVLAASQSVAQLAQFYKQQLTDANWSGVRALSAMGSGQALKQATVSAQRGRERIEVVIVRDAGTKVVLNVATEL